MIQNTSPIQCILVSGNKAVKKVENELRLRGFDIKAILYPTVEEGKERIRICIHSFNTAEEIKSFVESLEELLK